MNLCINPDSMYILIESVNLHYIFSGSRLIRSSCGNAILSVRKSVVPQPVVSTALSETVLNVKARLGRTQKEIKQTLDAEYTVTQISYTFRSDGSGKKLM